MCNNLGEVEPCLTQSWLVEPWLRMNRRTHDSSSEMMNHIYHVHPLRGCGEWKRLIYPTNEPYRLDGRV
ncbi:MAG: hypothetical protein K2H32_06380 [Muribaculaceae bacterium]|nr:hypothetical protein [Muribaculaceae bacterium]